MGPAIGGGVLGAGAVVSAIASERARSKGIRSLRRAESNALDELDKSFQGPLEGLRLAPEFFGLLQSDELAGTPLAGGLAIQNQLQSEALAGLRGDPSFAAKLPKDLESSIGEQLSSHLGALGVETSPASAIEAALRFSGGSEAIRTNRINSALAVLNATGQGSIYPGSSEFLNLGANLALNKANVRGNSALRFADLSFQRAGQFGQLAGQLFGAAAGASGLFGGPGGFAGAGQFLGLSQPQFQPPGQQQQFQQGGQFQPGGGTQGYNQSIFGPPAQGGAGPNFGPFQIEGLQSAAFASAVA